MIYQSVCCKRWFGDGEDSVNLGISEMSDRSRGQKAEESGIFIVEAVNGSEKIRPERPWIQVPAAEDAV